jgi:anti-sigma regulatory factor (Ser/Thr protein kinase)
MLNSPRVDRSPVNSNKLSTSNRGKVATGYCLPLVNQLRGLTARYPGRFAPNASATTRQSLRWRACVPGSRRSWVGVILLLKTSDYLLSLDALARLLCPVRFQYLMLFLALVRAAHYWTETHPEIAFRPVQECLTNIHRHSGSKTALIRLEREGDRVRVKVEDQGNGMSPERLAEVQSHGTGVGITGMRERIRHFCGDLVVESNGSGTRVCATFPLKPRPSRDPSKTQQDVA